ncbi:MAG: hypothetical protein H0T73_12465 [Ardenticatenales bacterium]|nr:hypothetical protein [Ardenticatenales bacterium]
MLEWKIVDEVEPAQSEPPPAARWRRWGWLWVATLLLVAVGHLLWFWLQVQEGRLQADIADAVLREERALRGDVVTERWYTLSDPDAPADWQEGYHVSFAHAYDELPMPQIMVLALADDRALVQLTYESEVLDWQTLRAYRLVGQEWRRTPVDGFLQKNQRAMMGQGERFQVVASEENIQFLEKHPEWWLDVGALQEHLQTTWPVSCAECSLYLTIHPQEFTPFTLAPTTAPDRLPLLIPSPWLFQPDWDSPLPPANQYRLAVAAAVVAAHTYPRNASGQGRLPVGDGLALLRMLQQAEARQWALDESEHRAVRNEWRLELNGQWPTPFEGPLPTTLEDPQPEERERWLAVNLLLEKQMALAGPETPGTLAAILLSYDPSLFRWERFFQALIGGSMSDLESLSRDYVLTMEP